MSQNINEFLRSVRWLGFVGGILVAVFLQLGFATRTFAADKSTDDRTVIIQTDHGPVKGKIVRPESSIEKPGDVGKRAHTPLEVVIPEKPIAPPPVPHSNKGK